MLRTCISSPYEKIFRVRFRIDGVLEEVSRPPLALAGKIAARIKVMSRLDVSERRVPQDGRIKLKLSKNKAIDFRVSTCPTLFGEKAVLRILDSDAAKLQIDQLGYEDFQKELFLKNIHKPYGMFLVHGADGKRQDGVVVHRHQYHQSGRYQHFRPRKTRSKSTSWA